MTNTPDRSRKRLDVKELGLITALETEYLIMSSQISYEFKPISGPHTELYTARHREQFPARQVPPNNLRPRIKVLGERWGPKDTKVIGPKQHIGKAMVDDCIDASNMANVIER